LIADAEAMADLDAEMGTYEDEEIDMETIEDAQARVDADQAVIANAKNWMAAAYRDAAAALLAAELIDSANVDAVAGVIAGVWVADDEEVRIRCKAWLRRNARSGCFHRHSAGRSRGIDKEGVNHG
jgi:hypothetical protein